MSLSRTNRPLYRQIYKIIKDRILHGAYPIGSNIPSEPQLEKEFGVSKITVRNAIKELAQEGYVEPGSGKGTKVIRNTSASKLSKWKRFTELLVEEGHQLQKEWVQAKAIVNQAETECSLLFGERCIRIERLYRLNDVPYIHFTHYLAPRINGLETAMDIQSLYEMLEEQNISLGKFRDEFTVAAAPFHVAKQLQLEEGFPVLKRTRYSYEESGDAIEYSIGYYNTKLHPYVVNYDA
ncbi:GntR family transcriptional regulator [Paenibacillus sp. CC-CFT747]|nr:GntR family transcriptional regulator [Paenibacillus sp. CC-CFT747]